MDEEDLEKKIYNPKIKNAKILLVEDNNSIANFVSTTLLNNGYSNLTVVDNALDAVNLVKLRKEQKNQFDMVIFDWNVPRISGYDKNHTIYKLRDVHSFYEMMLLGLSKPQTSNKNFYFSEGSYNSFISNPFDELEILSQLTTYLTQYFNKMDSKILIVEDYKPSQIIISRLLRGLSYKNNTLRENGKESIDLIEDMCNNNISPFDLILMDLYMPIMNGYVATETIRSSVQGYENIPIIGLSALAMKGDKEKALEAGCTDLIQKPIGSFEFQAKVEYHLGFMKRNEFEKWMIKIEYDKEKR